MNEELKQLMENQHKKSEELELIQKKLLQNGFNDALLLAEYFTTSKEAMDALDKVNKALEKLKKDGK